MKFDSIAEITAAPAIAALGGTHCTSFAPYLSEFYHDAESVEQEARPDSLIVRSDSTYTFIEIKSGKLNNHYTRSSSREALADAYTLRFRRSAAGMNNAYLSKALFALDRRGKVAVIDHGFNHALWKQAAVQAQHGWQRFVIVFKNAPCEYDAKRYVAAGLVFCTLKTLPDLLRVIELAQHGILVPFVFKNRNYSYSVTPDASSLGLSPEAVEANDRERFLAAVVADQVAIATYHATFDTSNPFV